jgi:hypothetical protein
MKNFIFFTFIAIFTSQNAFATEKLACTVAITIVDRINDLQAKIDHKLALGETEGLRSLFAALQSRLRMARAAGIDVDQVSKTSRPSDPTSLQKKIAFEQSEETDARGSDALEFLEIGREKVDEYNLNTAVYSANLNVVSTRKNGIPVVMDTRTGKILLSSPGKSNPWALSPSGKMAAHVVGDEIRVEAVDTGALLGSFQWVGTTFPKRDQLVVDDNGTVIATDSLGNWMVKTVKAGAFGYSRLVRNAKREKVSKLKLSADSKLLFTKASDSFTEILVIRDAITGKKTGEVDSELGNEWHSAADGLHYAFHATSRAVGIFSTVTYAKSRELFIPEIEEIYFVTASADLETVFVVTDARKLYFFEGTQLQQVLPIPADVVTMTYDDTTKILSTIDTHRNLIRYR